MTDASLDLPLYGVIAEFAEPEAAIRAAREARDGGFARMEAYGPFPVPELAEAIGFREYRMGPCVLAGGILGGISGYALQYYATVIAYPHNVGGRPLNSWPAFVPATFETTILGAVLVGLLSFFVLSRLPRYSHPVFTAPHFERATRDRFFLCLRVSHTEGTVFSTSEAERLLHSCGALSVNPVFEEEKQ